MIDLTFTKDNPNAKEKKRNRQISTLEFIIVKIRSFFFFCTLFPKQYRITNMFTVKIIIYSN